MRQPIRVLEQTIGIRFRNKNLLLSALTHPSYQRERSGMEPPENFQRLEFLGDSILNLFIATNLYRRFPEANEGLLSRLRSTLVSRKFLARIARSIRLKAFLLLGEQERRQPNPIREKIVVDAFEALIAAIYFDRGQKSAERFLLKRFKPFFNQKKLFQFDPNPKSTLQEYTQKELRMLPVYQARHAKARGLFTAWVTIKGVRKAKGEGRTKQEAESQAAALFLRKLKMAAGARRSAPAKKKISFRTKNVRVN